MEADNGVHVRLVEVDPNFDSIAGGIVDFGGDEPEPVHLLTPVVTLPQKEEHQLLVDLLFVELCLRHLEDKTTSVLILRIFPLGLDSLAEVFDGVDFFE